MRRNEFVALEKRLLPDFPGFDIKGPLMLIPPVQHLLRGFCFDATRGNKRDFHVNMFFMPLCVPVNFIHFLFGHRIRRFKTWNADEPGLEANLTLEMQKDVPFLMSLRTPKDVAEAIKPDLGWNANCHEAFGYSLLQAGDVEGALEAIDVLLNLVGSRGGWEGDVASRARLLRDKLLANADEALRQLDGWEHETAENLGLEEFR